MFFYCTAGVTNETAATKIVELSKKVRELTSELESEKTKGKQLGKKCQELQNKVCAVVCVFCPLGLLIVNCTKQPIVFYK